MTRDHLPQSCFEIYQEELLKNLEELLLEDGIDYRSSSSELL